ncbi:hypothetical protein A3F37_02985 [Candidatus Saccharibacteria bacterium RIFCSPHIGHO2_12_FULL_41_12]|nr:MAG: hypothetical protein A3F37_02985 [Candidatus Saccharibacteria bacterium RIFCSPHIGHO2_12_FULL_41_12]
MRTWDLGYEQTQALMEVPDAGSPVYVYDAAAIRGRCVQYDWAMRVGDQVCKNYFAVKALPNPEILEIAREQGMGFDCSSPPEITLAQRAGAEGEQMIFTSNNTADGEFDAAVGAHAMINFDDLSLVERFVGQNRPTLPIAFCRSNPGDIEFEGVNEDIIGKPSEAKFGMPDPQIVEAYRLLKGSGVERFGLHTMLLSNELDHKNHLAIARHMFELAGKIKKFVGIDMEMINLGGGFGVAYRPEQEDFDIESYGAELSELYADMGMDKLGSPQVITENGRWVTADAGFLLAQVINRKDTHKTFVGVDATMADFMRPGMYGAYHHITVLSDRPDFDPEDTETVNVAGSLCENNDQFAIDRELPKTQEGDIMVIHTTGAHGRAMGFNYNGKLRAGEVLINDAGDEAPRLIRRKETVDDLFATLVPSDDE